MDKYNLAININDTWLKSDISYKRTIEFLKSISNRIYSNIPAQHQGNIFALSNGSRYDEIIVLSESYAKEKGYYICTQTRIDKLFKIGDIVSDMESNFFGRVTAIYFNGNFSYKVTNGDMTVNFNENDKLVKVGR